jgi:hypothetical protein
VQRSWAHIADVLCSQWNVIGVDLQSQPFRASWDSPGKGPPTFNPATDWNAAATRLGNFVLSKCPRWLVFVEGVGETPGARDQQLEGGAHACTAARARASSRCLHAPSGSSLLPSRALSLTLSCRLLAQRRRFLGREPVGRTPKPDQAEHAESSRVLASRVRTVCVRCLLLLPAAQLPSQHGQGVAGPFRVRAGLLQGRDRLREPGRPVRYAQEPKVAQLGDRVLSSPWLRILLLVPRADQPGHRRAV